MLNWQIKSNCYGLSREY